MDAAFLQVHHCVVEILGARAPMTACLGQKAGGLLRRELPGINAAFAVDDKGNGLNRTGIGLNLHADDLLLVCHSRCPLERRGRALRTPTAPRPASALASD